MSYRADLDRASIQAANNAARIDQAIDHLLHQLHTLDGYPTTTNSTGPRGQRCIRVQLEGSDGEPLTDHAGRPVTDQVPVTTVEDAALKRNQIGDQLADLAAHVHGITVMHNELARIINQAIATRITEPPKLCDATGREGYMQPRNEGGWSDLNCHNIPARGPLCIPCYHRERRWRLEHGLPTREDTAA